VDDPRRLEGAGGAQLARRDHWTRRRPAFLETPGTAPTDRAKGQHPDVIVRGDRAFIVYFTHQSGEPEAATDSEMVAPHRAARERTERDRWGDLGESRPARDARLR
jgi:hypothetical protein